MIELGTPCFELAGLRSSVGPMILRWMAVNPAEGDPNHPGQSPQHIGRPAPQLPSTNQEWRRTVRTRSEQCHVYLDDTFRERYKIIKRFGIFRRSSELTPRRPKSQPKATKIFIIVQLCT